MKPVYQPGNILTNRRNLFEAFMYEKKIYNSFHVTVCMSTLFVQAAGHENDEVNKKMFLMKGLILFAVIYQM